MGVGLAVASAASAAYGAYQSKKSADASKDAYKEEQAELDEAQALADKSAAAALFAQGGGASSQSISGRSVYSSLLGGS